MRETIQYGNETKIIIIILSPIFFFFFCSLCAKSFDTRIKTQNRGSTHVPIWPRKKVFIKTKKNLIFFQVCVFGYMNGICFFWSLNPVFSSFI